MDYEWIKHVAKLSDDRTSITFNDNFNEIIEPNTLPKNLTNLIFGALIVTTIVALLQ